MTTSELVVGKPYSITVTHGRHTRSYSGIFTGYDEGDLVFKSAEIPGVRVRIKQDAKFEIEELSTEKERDAT